MIELPKPLLNVVFKDEDGEHLYSINEKDTYYSGVTTILGATLAKPALVPWASKLVAETYTRLIKPQFALHEQGLEVNFGAIEKEAKSAPRKTRDDAGDIGTIVHNAIDSYLLTGKWVPFVDEKADNAFGHFLAWHKKADWKCVIGDTPVVSVELGYGGRLDMMWDDHGALVLGDIKTGKGYYEYSHGQQLGGYSLAFQETYGIRPDRACIFHVRPEKMEVHWIDNLKDFENAFMHTVSLYKFKQKCKS